jgi:hypothetical protein
VRLDPAHVGLHQDIRRQMAIVFRDIHFPEDFGHDITQSTLLNFDGDVLWDFKSL